jgi:tripartite-type tricarboxylate transporter receptor subunit TctC
MQRRPFLHAALSGAALAGLQPALAQSWPTRPLRLVVPFPPGGPTDSFARLYAAALAAQLGQPVVVDNKAGASGALGTLEVRRSAADGYTLLFGTASTHALYNLIQNKPQYDALEDFAYVGVLGGAPVAFAVAPNMPRTLKTVVIAARMNPGKYNYGSPGNGTLLHVAAERLKQVTGAPITHVPYRGSAPAMQDLLGGNIELTVDTLGSLLPQHVAGRLRILAVASAQRLAVAPDIPTVAQSADLARPFEAMLWNVVTAPRETPAQVLTALTDATRSVMDNPALRSKLAGQSMFAEPHLGPAAARAYVVAERAKWKPIVVSLGDLSTG